MKKVLAVMALVVLSATGCATIVNGSRQNVVINTNVSSSMIRIYDSTGKLVSEGRGNLATSLKRARDKFEEENYTVKVTTPNGQTRTFEINSELSMWYPVGNLLVFGIPGWIVDSFTEAKYKLRTTDGLDPSKGINVNF